MKPRFPLTSKILLLAVTNVALLVLVFAAFIRLQLDEEFESFLMATARERILAVSRLLAIELRDTAPAERDGLLRQYSETQGVTFSLYDNEAGLIAGPPADLPPEVAERLRRTRFGSLRSQGPPPAGETSASPGIAPPFLVVTKNPTRYWVGVRIPFPGGAPETSTRATLLLLSPTLFSNPFFFQIQPWLLIGAVAVAVSVLCWLPLVRGLTRTVTEMMNATAAVAEGQFDVQLNTKRSDELGRLAASIHQMAARLNSYVQGQKRFLGDIAHELRSPLGRMQVALGILERRAGPEQLGSIRDLNEEVEAMSALTHELLTFAKAGMRTEPLALVPVNVREVAERAVSVEGASAPDLRIEVDPALKVAADPEYLFRALANLVRNAVRYAAAQGPITISAHREGDHARIIVADSGPGVPEEALEKIFEPFYRLDASRDRRSGGTGLGLAIVHGCVQACGGSVECRNRKPSGLEVVTTLRVV